MLLEQQYLMVAGEYIHPGQVIRIVNQRRERCPYYGEAQGKREDGIPEPEPDRTLNVFCGTNKALKRVDGFYVRQRGYLPVVLIIETASGIRNPVLLWSYAYSDPK